jgi:hypothetical protein
VAVHTGHAHHVTGVIRANTGVGTSPVGTPTSSAVPSAPAAAAIQRRRGQLRSTSSVTRRL